MAYSFQVTFDCKEPHVLADWWAQALGWEVESQDAEFIRSMIDQGFATEADTATHKGNLVWKTGAAVVHPEDEPGPGRRRLYFEQVPEPKTVKNRVHLDVRVGADRVEAEVERLKGIGGTYLYRGEQGPHWWITMADPEGNELCIT